MYITKLVYNKKSLKFPLIKVYKTTNTYITLIVIYSNLWFAIVVLTTMQVKDNG